MILMNLVRDDIYHFRLNFALWVFPYFVSLGDWLEKEKSGKCNSKVSEGLKCRLYFVKGNFFVSLSRNAFQENLRSANKKPMVKNIFLSSFLLRTIHHRHHNLFYIPFLGVLLFIRPLQFSKFDRKKKRKRRKK